MKKLLALLLAVCMGLAVAACGGTATTGTPAPASTIRRQASVAATPSSIAPTAPLTEEDTGTDTLDKVGFYDPNYDYTQNKRFKVAYMCIGMTVFNNDFDKSYAHWASLSNVEYTGIWSASDNDSFLTQIRAFKAGLRRLLMDPDMMIYPSIADVCSEIGMHWMGGMGAAMSTMKTVRPTDLFTHVGFDHITFGIECGNKLLEYASQACRTSRFPISASVWTSRFLLRFISAFRARCRLGPKRAFLNPTVYRGRRQQYDTGHGAECRHGAADHKRAV